MASMKKHSIIITSVFLFSIILFSSLNFINKGLQQHRLNREFICPENQSLEQADTDLYNYTQFYMDNYPDMTISNFLGLRMELLISHNCTTTLKNLAKNNNGVLPNQNSIDELKK